MSKPQLAQILTAVTVAGALGLVRYRSNAVKPDGTPQDAIYAMLDAAREGRVKDYLRAFGGQLEPSLRQNAAEMSEARFAEYLRDSNASIRGVALLEPQPLSANEVKVQIEYVYQDRNERQWMYLTKAADGRWRIARMDAAQRVPAAVPYGTSVQ